MIPTLQASLPRHADDDRLTPNASLDRRINFVPNPSDAWLGFRLLVLRTGWRWRRNHHSPQRSYKGNGIFRPLFSCRVKRRNMFWKTAALKSCGCLALSLGTLAKRNGPDVVLLVPARPMLVNIGVARWPSKPYSHAHAQYISELSPHAQKLNST